MPKIGEVATIGRKRGQTEWASRIGHSAWLPAVRRYHPDVRGVVVIAIGMACRDKGDKPPIRRPGGITVNYVAIGELSGFPTVNCHYEHMRPTVTT